VYKRSVSVTTVQFSAILRAYLTVFAPDQV